MSSWPIAPGDWQKYDDMESRLTTPVTERMLNLARLTPGMKVLDVGSGTGEPALRAAHRVAPGGSVLGIDPAPSMLQLAREKAAREENLDVEFQQIRAEEFERSGQFDVATARWSLMYMDAPDQAIERVRRALKPAGGFVAAFWAEPERVEYATLWRRVLARYRDLPPIAPDQPGVFRYCSEESIRRSMNGAGFRLEHMEELEIPVVEVADGEGFVAWVLALGGTVARLVREMPEDRQHAWADELAREAERYRDGAAIRIGGVTRVVLGRTHHAKSRS